MAWGLRAFFATTALMGLIRIWATRTPPWERDHNDGWASDPRNPDAECYRTQSDGSGAAE